MKLIAEGDPRKIRIGRSIGRVAHVWALNATCIQGVVRAQEARTQMVLLSHCRGVDAALGDNREVPRLNL
jgi:hypothetical protein